MAIPYNSLNSLQEARDLPGTAAAARSSSSSHPPSTMVLLAFSVPDMVVLMYLLPYASLVGSHVSVHSLRT